MVPPMFDEAFGFRMETGSLPGTDPDRREPLGSSALKGTGIALLRSALDTSVLPAALIIIVLLLALGI